MPKSAEKRLGRTIFFEKGKIESMCSYPTILLIAKTPKGFQVIISIIKQTYTTPMIPDRFQCILIYF